MVLIGCDFHPSWQQVSWLDMETGETGEQKLVHAGGEAKQFYEQLAASVQAGDDPQPGEKRTATPFSEQGHAAEAQAVEPGGTEVVARAAAKKMGGVPARGLTRTAHHVGRADRKTGWSGAACRRREPAVEAFDDATGSGPKHRAGFRADPWRRRSFPARQAGGQLPGTNSTRRKFGLGAITKQGNRMLRALLVEAAQVAVVHDPGLRKQYRHRCHQKPKAVAKVAVARKLAVRL